MAEKVTPITLPEMVAAYGFDYLMSELIKLPADISVFPPDNSDNRWAGMEWIRLWHRAAERLSEVATTALDEYHTLKALTGIQEDTP